jgi:formate dehydrogenase major subunit
VAVLGAGPAGLSCAAKLVEAGHSVTVFEQNDGLGGMVNGVIAMDKYGTSLANETNAIFTDTPKDRLDFQFGKALDADLNLDKVMAQGFDGAFVGMGLWESKSLCKNGKPQNLWGALEFLGELKKGEQIDFAGKRVAVIGGGNTGMDVCHAAAKCGAESVYMICFESFITMPSWIHERQLALTDDISFLNLFMPKEYVAENGKVKAVKINHVNLAEPDETVFRAPIEIPGASLTVEADVIIEALGQKAPDNLKDILPGVNINKRGLVEVDSNTLATNRKGVFAGGDIINGGLMVVTAVADGVKAAEQINNLLKS